MLSRQATSDFWDSRLEWRRMFAEGWGTFLLVLVAGAYIALAGLWAFLSSSPQQAAVLMQSTQGGGFRAEGPWGFSGKEAEAEYAAFSALSRRLAFEHCPDRHGAIHAHRIVAQRTFTA